MDKTTRYLLLLLVVIIFFALAPLIVLYVSGRGFNLNSLSRSTGILDVQTEPANAVVYLDGEESDNTPTTIRFIKGGTYTIDVKKAGWWDWQKRLYIEPGKVTYAGTSNELIRLLPKNDPRETGMEQIESFVIKNNTIYAVGNKKLVVYNISGHKITNTTELPYDVKNLRASTHEDYLIATDISGNNVLFNIPESKLINLSPTLGKTTYLDIAEDETIFGITGDKLIAGRLNFPQTETLLEGTISFIIDSGQLYVARKSATQSIQTYMWNGKQLVAQSSLLEQPLPSGKNYELLITNQRELFLKIDQSIYRVNSQLDLINNQVTAVNLDRAHQLMTFQTPSEVYFYNFMSAKAELLSRATHTLSHSIVAPNMGYGFIAGPQGVEAIEIDNRNGQNIYKLMENSAVDKIYLSPREDQIVLLSSGKILTIEIRR